MTRNLPSAAIAMSIMLLAAACSQKAEFTPPGEMCHFVAHRLEVPVPQPEMLGQAATARPATTYTLAIEEGLSSADGPGPSSRGDDSPRLLSMSGGGQYGAFGAGLLAGWNGDGNLPDFHVVTGISTGSILSTFAFVNRSDLAESGYTLDREGQLLEVYAQPKEGQPGTGNFSTLLRKGAFADLAPLRDRLDGFLSDDILRAVAARHAAGRRLYVGVTNVDTGQAEAFDMGEMASRFASNQAGRALHWKDCYIDAILASSSAPMAARPVFIDNIMYVDGGVRFGMFSDAVIGALETRKARQEADPGAPRPPVVYAIVNGTLELPPRPCPKKDETLCTKENPLGTNEGFHRNWSIIELALRSEEMLVDQVYRFSAAAVKNDSCDQAGCFNFLRIEPDVERFSIALPDSLNGGNAGALSCPEWAKVDVRLDNPIQFQRRYMRCLIAYGKDRVVKAGWGDAD